jgi:hypothetical protein
MKEDFLHYIWRYKKLDLSNLYTTNKQLVSIEKVGDYYHDSGPDFFNAHLEIDAQKWVGTIEIDMASSHWYLYNRQDDLQYDNVILYVVWEFDGKVYRKDNSEIPILALKNFVSKDLLARYEKLKAQKSWINCQDGIKSITPFVVAHWQERLFFERLEVKSAQIETLLVQTCHDWEAVFFCFMAQSFGLNTNGSSFFAIAQSIPFSIIRKETFTLENLEALLFGRASLLDKPKEASYFLNLESRWDYLQHKYKLEKASIEPLHFFKHRPDNFPTIRLAQLAKLYHLHHNLFSTLMSVSSNQQLYDLLSVSVSEYWQSHYQFDKISTTKQKKLSTAFIDLLIVNTIVPFRFAYDQWKGRELSEDNIGLLAKIPPEQNKITAQFKTFGLASKNALESQSLLQLKNNYCDHGKCLQCAFGISLLR